MDTGQIIPRRDSTVKDKAEVVAAVGFDSGSMPRGIAQRMGVYPSPENLEVIRAACWEAVREGTLMPVALLYDTAFIRALPEDRCNKVEK